MLNELKANMKERVQYINKSVVNFFFKVMSHFQIAKKDIKFYRGNGGYVSPANFYNHRSGTFKKNKRKGL